MRRSLSALSSRSHETTSACPRTAAICNGVAPSCAPLQDHVQPELRSANEHKPNGHLWPQHALLEHHRWSYQGLEAKSSNLSSVSKSLSPHAETSSRACASFGVKHLNHQVHTLRDQRRASHPESHSCLPKITSVGTEPWGSNETQQVFFQHFGWLAVKLRNVQISNSFTRKGRIDM